MPKSVIVRLSGGLGNQFFQYAAGLSYSISHGMQLKLDERWFIRRRGEATVRNNYIHNYRISSRGLNFIERASLILYNARLLRPLSRFSRLSLVDDRCIFERCLRNNNATTVYMDGFWQKLEFFDAHRALLRSDLSLKNDDFVVRSEYYSGVSRGNSVAVHIRRGDYINTLDGKCNFGALGEDYYWRSIKHIQKMVPNPTFYFFSDDREWVVKKFIEKDPRNFTFAGISSDECASRDLELMKICKHKIIANSTFSWWAAYLGMCKEGLVIAPRQWTAKRPDPRDLYPPEWIKM